ncbi:cytochrome P450 [Mycobacterium dioxanotrophicus]|jgi:cytochrome P450|uniref:Cytochrome P450 n=1 Tax=Mycobacterium dioxanotrophicus TaxID=482462 RepID=A0A1Y0BXQ2_9MYCO|nr:cytochrome P450 [Mycobacterium dioxanotrophicus]ART67665.1 cytochrome P450 [Mycobacterium dioxanotrophicus]
MTTVAEGLLLELLDPANRADPYPTYRRIRERGPLQLPEAHVAVFSTFAECDAVLRHPSSCSDRMKSTLAQRHMAEHDAEPRGATSFLFLDAPDHTRLRGLVSKAFVPKVINALEPDIRTLVDGLLDQASDGPFDAIAGLAYPLPVAVICRLLGVPIEDEPKFRDASALLAQALDPFMAMTGETSELFDQQMAAGRWLADYLRDLIAQRRRRPGDDLMSALIQVEESGVQLTEDEIVATCDLLLIAGHETTVNLIANAILAMLRHPQQWTALGGEPGRVSRVIEETMRYDPPVQLVSRIAGADMTIGDVEVPNGDTMLLLVAAAHRDPGVFDRADEFDPDRGAIRHLGFGKGPHFCLGAPLARLEASVALSAITARFPQAHLAADPVYKPNLTLRGMSTLFVAP